MKLDIKYMNVYTQNINDDMIYIIDDAMNISDDMWYMKLDISF